MSHEELLQASRLHLSLLFPAAALKNQDTGHLFLNDGDELPESRVLVEKGVVWVYSYTQEQDSIQTTGPLQYSVLLMVRLWPGHTGSG